MVVYFDTVRRNRPVKEGGELVRVDWKKKTCDRVVPIFPTDPEITCDPNPRGNTRGGKGIALNGNELFVGSYHSLLVFDLELNLKRKISNNLFVNIHEMDFLRDSLWVSSTAIDAAVQVDRSGKTLSSWWPREERKLQKKLGLAAADINKQEDNRLLHLNSEPSTRKHHTHLNCVTQSNNRIYALLNKFGVFARIFPDFKIVLQDSRLKGSHSAKITPDHRVLFCGSFSRSILIYDLKKRHFLRMVNLLDFPEIRAIYENFPDLDTNNRSVFVRGLDIVDKNRVLVGISPAAVLEIDLENARLTDLFQYSRDVADAVHGLVHLN